MRTVTANVTAAVVPRLMTMRDAAAYISVSYWTMRRYVFGGHIATVRLPGLGRKTDRPRLLLDRADLDAWIASHKHTETLE